MNQCFQSVSDGKAAVATALTNQGVATASDATFATMASNVTIAGSARYNSGYSAGVTAADNRANTNSVNYQTGYNNGYNAARANISAVDGNVLHSVHYSGTAYVNDSFTASRSGICFVAIIGDHGNAGQYNHGLTYAVMRNGVAVTPFADKTDSYQQTVGYAFSVNAGDTIAISASYANVGGNTQMVNVVRAIAGSN